jgi:hypothetical protein
MGGRDVGRDDEGGDGDQMATRMPRPRDIPTWWKVFTSPEAAPGVLRAYEDRWHPDPDQVARIGRQPAAKIAPGCLGLACSAGGALLLRGGHRNATMTFNASRASIAR